MLVVCWTILNLTTTLRCVGDSAVRHCTIGTRRTIKSCSYSARWADSYGYVGSVLDYPESDDNIALAIVPSATADGRLIERATPSCSYSARWATPATCDQCRRWTTLKSPFPTTVVFKSPFSNEIIVFVFKTGSNEIIVSSEGLTLLSEKVVIDFLRFGCNFARQTRVDGDDRGGRRLADSH